MEEEILEYINKNYISHRVLGKGSFGQVYLVQDQNGDSFAIKTMIVEPSKMHTIVREIKLLEYLSSIPNSDTHIVKYYGYEKFISKTFPTKTIFIIKLEYIVGYTLKSMIGKQLTKEEICSLFKKLLDDLIFIHSYGITHGDIKPDNIMFNSERIVLIDFGMGCAPEVYHALHGNIKCTIGGARKYMAPEILAYIDKTGTPKINLYKTDIYSLGRVFQDFCKSHDPELCKLIHAMTSENERDRPSLKTVSDHIGSYCRETSVFDSQLDNFQSANEPRRNSNSTGESTMLME